MKTSHTHLHPSWASWRSKATQNRRKIEQAENHHDSNCRNRSTRCLIRVAMFARCRVNSYTLPVVLDPPQLKTDLLLIPSQQYVFACVHVHRPLYGSTFRLGGDCHGQWAFKLIRKLVGSIAIHVRSWKLSLCLFYSKIGGTQKMKDVKHTKSLHENRKYENILVNSDLKSCCENIKI